MPESIPLELGPRQIQERIAAGEKFCLIDVREEWEFQIAAIKGATLIPMGSVPSHLGQLDAQAGETPLLVVCHHGVRSLNVAHWLRQQGVDNCVSLNGGIDQWSREIDPSIPRY